MGKKRRIRAPDGLTVREMESLRDAPEGVRAAGENPGSFAWKIRDAETFWRAHAPAAGTVPQWLTLPWYAREILACIGTVRDGLTRGLKEHHVLAAMELGKLHEGAQWRFNAGDEMRLGVKVRTKNRAIAREPRPRDRTALIPRDEQITTEARRLRQKYPYSREHSTRWLAAEIARTQSRAPGSVRRWLTILGIR